MQLNPYLIFNGQCRAAFEFYERVLGGKITGMQTQGDSPMADQTPAAQRDAILHARLEVGDEVLMGSDSGPEPVEKTQGFSVSLTVEKAPDADRIFNALAEGGKVNMPIQETFWATRFGMLVDRFGIPWMVNCNRPT